MKLRTSLLALALSAAVSPAFAAGDDAFIDSTTIVIDAGFTLADVFVLGDVEVTSRSAATVDQDQLTEDNVSLGDGDHIADLTGDALRDASGNIGVNVAAGVGNAQANDGAISAVDAGRAFASAQVFSSQVSLDNFGASLFTTDTNYSATLDGDALRDVSGNVGVNVAAGVGNNQGNAMAASVNSSSRYSLATADSEQFAVTNELNSLFADIDLYAFFGGDALRGAEGNIGVNVASGIGNLQHNGLSIASGGN